MRPLLSNVFDFQEYTDENVLLVLCGNKSDLDHRRKVKEEKAANVAKVLRNPHVAF